MRSTTCRWRWPTSTEGGESERRLPTRRPSAAASRSTKCCRAGKSQSGRSSGSRSCPGSAAATWIDWRSWRVARSPSSPWVPSGSERFTAPDRGSTGGSPLGTQLSLRTSRAVGGIGRREGREGGSRDDSIALVDDDALTVHDLDARHAPAPLAHDVLVALAGVDVVGRLRRLRRLRRFVFTGHGCSLSAPPLRLSCIMTTDPQDERSK